MEALLVGHEDWVFSAAWQPDQDAESAKPCLLSASMDRNHDALAAGVLLWCTSPELPAKLHQNASFVSRAYVDLSSSMHIGHLRADTSTAYVRFLYL